MLNESGLAASMKQDWRGVGYTVILRGDLLVISGSCWAVILDKDAVPKKCLGLLAEHMGWLPEDRACYLVQKKFGAQGKLFEEESAFWNEMAALEDDPSDGPEELRYKPTSLTLMGMEVWQGVETKTTICIGPERSRILDLDGRAKGGILRKEGLTVGALVFKGGEGAAVVWPQTRSPENVLLQQLDGFPWLGELQ